MLLVCTHTCICTVSWQTQSPILMQTMQRQPGPHQGCAAPEAVCLQPFPVCSRSLSAAVPCLQPFPACSRSPPAAVPRLQPFPACSHSPPAAIPCLSACIPACSHSLPAACVPACSHSLSVCLRPCLQPFPVCLPASLPAAIPCLSACIPACSHSLSVLPAAIPCLRPCPARPPAVDSPVVLHFHALWFTVKAAAAALLFFL